MGGLGFAPVAYAQTESLEPGREARLFVRGVAAVFEGTLTSVSADALAVTLGDGSSFTIPTAQVERAEVLVRRRNTLRGALVGGFLGLGAGVGLVVRGNDRDVAVAESGGDGFGTPFEGWKLIVSPLAGAAAGAVVGHFFRTPRWAPGLLPSAGQPADLTFGWSVSGRFP